MFKYTVTKSIPLHIQNYKFRLKFHNEGKYVLLSPEHTSEET